MRPRCYVGIDVGTTYTKAVVLPADGGEGEVLRAPTPTTVAGGATFFDLPALEGHVRRFLEAIRSRYLVLGASTASVGESVVPVRDGRALANALVWHDPITQPVERRRRDEVEQDLPRDRRGSASNYTFSLYKILWMRETLGVGEPQWWLPLSAYLVYRLTGQPRWDYSQASRSMLLDAPAGRWGERILERYGLAASLPPLSPLGTVLGLDQHGTAWALGGHDHIAGLYCVRAILAGAPFVLDSIGSSESVVALTDSREPFASGGAGGRTVGAAFDRDLFYVMTGLRISGLLLECLARLAGRDDVDAHYAALNPRLSAQRDRLGPAFPMVAAGDPVAGDHLHGFSMLDVPVDADPVRLAHSAYVYLGTMARLCVEGLGPCAEGRTVVVIGPTTSNALYLRYRAAILHRPVALLGTGEVGGLGAALCAAAGLGDRVAVEAFAGRHPPAVVEPGDQVAPDLRQQSDALLERCRALWRGSTGEGGVQG